MDYIIIQRNIFKGKDMEAFSSPSDLQFISEKVYVKNGRSYSVVSALVDIA
jgi:hypothetical protein